MKGWGNTSYMDNKKQHKKSSLHEELATTYASTQMEVGAQTEKSVKFHGQQGHGFAAEQANDMIDKIYGRNARIVGDDNAKNGADRLVDGQLIQTKYCNNAKSSINAGFDNDGQYKYIDANGNPMQIEVPSDQYDEAVRIMEERIRNGQVAGVTNPKEAKKIVRKGNVTYQQAMNIAKAGTVESILYDSAHGVVIGLGAMGISSSIVLAKEMWNGEDPRIALDKALYAGIQAGGTGFLTEVVTGQLMRTGITNGLKDISIAVVKALPSKVRHLLVNTFRNGAKIYGGAATNNLAKLLRTNFVAGAAIVLVSSGPQIMDAIRGRISSGQLFKGILTTAGGVGGGSAGAAIGTLVGGPVGTFIGGIIGGWAGGTASQKALDKLIEDDSVGLIKILNQEFARLAEEYLLSEEEVGIILDTLGTRMTANFLKDMYASSSPKDFAGDVIEDIVVHLISHRARVQIPSESEVISRVDMLLDGFESGRDMSYLTVTKEIKAEEIGEVLLGREVEKSVANKAWYVTKQVNMNMQRGESALEQIKSSSLQYIEQREQQMERIANVKGKIEEKLNGK